MERAERVRLLYVAMTRAKRRVVLVGDWSLTPSATDGDARAADRTAGLFVARRGGWPTACFPNRNLPD